MGDTNADELIQRGREALRQQRVREADEAFEQALEAAAGALRAKLAQRAGLLALRAAQPRLAVRWYRRAGELDPRDAEARHDRGLAHLECGELGLAAQAQAEALAIDPGHAGARAQRAAALEALGDDRGAAAELRELLSRIGPQPALQVRLSAIDRAAARAESSRLVGAPPDRLLHSPLVGTAFSRAPRASAAGAPALRAPFGELRASGAAGGRIASLLLIFDDMQASLQRNDASWGGTTVDAQGRTVPLDEFTSAAVVFLSQAAGVEPQRARRLLDWLLTKEAGLGPHRWAGLDVGFHVEGEGGARRYGLSAALPDGAFSSR